MTPSVHEHSNKMQDAATTNLSDFPLPYRSIDAEVTHLLDRGYTTEVCSDLHKVVLDFRNVHGIDVAADQETRARVIEAYPLSRVRPAEAAAIEKISTPSEYADLRQGGRPNSPYKPLDSSHLADLCREISAALVWKSEMSRGRSNEDRG
jgi:hypothetical protein